MTMELSLANNDTLTTPLLSSLTGMEELYVNVKYYVYHVILPIIFAIGMIGNMLNLIVFVCRCKKIDLESLEKSSMAGLISLSVSDFLFCLVGFPSAFFQESVTLIQTNSTKRIVGFYYNLYRGGLHNLFLFTGTWLVVAISVERYIVVCHVLRARFLIRLRRTIIVHVAIFVLGIFITIPEFIKYSVHWEDCPGGTVCIYKQFMPLFLTDTFPLAYHALWSIFGTYIPLAFLIFTNVNLIMGLMFHRAMSISDPSRYACSRVTKTVVAIVVLFVLLVCPSMVLESVTFHSANSTGLSIAIVLLNLLQGVKFASNFLLYLAVNKRFRRNVSRAFNRQASNSSKFITSEQTRRTLDVEMV